ncbi:hypothetical protein [Parabacteroides bouchesdurhonensis]|uniref:hypothetical protein n=1 Tax=Parabacteroides bouchesdurhonensis TaxID=1936995 RepID=UPI000C81D983|nr:hypothetical protein [Parabacteroides bouchesdurhonensis]
MQKYFEQVECIDINAGKTFLKKRLPNNLLLFVFSGNLIINCNYKSDLEINEGYFVLLPADTFFIATTVTTSHIVIIHAGTLSEMIIEDPEWNPDNPQILPILPALAKTLKQIEYLKKIYKTRLN